MDGCAVGKSEHLEANHKRPSERRVSASHTHQPYLIDKRSAPPLTTFQTRWVAQLPEADDITHYGSRSSRTLFLHASPAQIRRRRPSIIRRREETHTNVDPTTLCMYPTLLQYYLLGGTDQVSLVIASTRRRS